MTRLIDADELKKAVEKWFVNDRYYHPLEKPNNMSESGIKTLIDNAPTVNIIQYKDWYLVNKAGAKELLDRERPQGEWIMQLHNCDGEFYTCSVCGRMIRVSPYVEDNETLKDYPFCHCGADMRKGGAE